MGEERPKRAVFVVRDLEQVPYLYLTIGTLQKVGKTWFEGTITVAGVVTIYNREKQLRRWARDRAERERRWQEREQFRLMCIRKHMAPYDLEDPC